MEMFTASNIAYYATWLSAIAFLVASGTSALEVKWLPSALYFGLFMANGSIALMARQAL